MSFINLVFAALISALAFNAVGTLIYGALGQSLTSTAGKYSLVLYGVMLLSTIGFSLKPTAAIVRLLSNALAVAVVGFYYGGTALQLSPAQQAAPVIAGAIAGATGACLIAAGLSLVQISLIQVGLASLRTIVIYGAAFLNGAIGLMLLSVGQWWGFGLIGLTIFSLGVTVRSISDTVRYLKRPI